MYVLIAIGADCETNNYHDDCMNRNCCRNGNSFSCEYVSGFTGEMCSFEIGNFLITLDSLFRFIVIHCDSCECSRSLSSCLLSILQM